MAKTASAYAQAGVDIDEMMVGLSTIKTMVRRTHTPGVRNEIGSFGGLFDAPGRDQLLVASTDGVGTKLKVAVMTGRHDTVGQDLVNHCVNDILVLGATPLFFLDYLGAARLRSDVFRDIVSGLCKACRQNGCALLGGETAEMPGLYPDGEYDLVGTIIGSVARRGVIDGRAVRAGDKLIGLPSGGLQTNGFSLARKVIFDQCGLAPSDLSPGTRRMVADHLLAVHRSFLRPVKALTASVRIRGMAHITGGGFTDNLPRILPDGLDAVIERKRWRVPPIFNFIEREGAVDRDEMYRVFNMGIGFVIVVRDADTQHAVKRLTEQRQRPAVIGQIEKGNRCVRYA